jgi:hypothetical protein
MIFGPGAIDFDLDVNLLRDLLKVSEAGDDA